MSWGNAWGTRAWGGGAPYSVSAATPISLNANSLHEIAHPVAGLVKIGHPANTLHEIAHPVTAQPPISASANTLHEVAHPVAALVKVNVPANTLHVVDHIVSGVVGIIANASSLHAVDHIVSAAAPISATANTLHSMARIVGAKPPISANANTLHVVVHPISGAAPLSPSAGTLHVRVHGVPTGIGPGANSLHIVRHIVPVSTIAAIAGKPLVVILNHPTQPYNPVVTVPANSTPLLTAALLDAGEGADPIIPLTGASVTFELAKLGGETIYTRPATIDDIATAKVSFQTSAGDLPEPGKYLGRFRVTYPSTAQQHFPGDRYIELTAV